MTPGEHAPDPRGVRSPAEFLARLQALKDWSGLTYRELSARAEARGDVLPRSTVANMLSRTTLPREELLTAFVRACGTGPAGLEEWRTARRELTGRRGYGTGAPDPAETDLGPDPDPATIPALGPDLDLGPDPATIPALGPDLDPAAIPALDPAAIPALGPDLDPDPDPAAIPALDPDPGPGAAPDSTPAPEGTAPAREGPLASEDASASEEAPVPEDAPAPEEAPGPE
ncbi:helix-turn-helix domain-containing protein, partial [Streptomyces sp. NRRL F-6492]